MALFGNKESKEEKAARKTAELFAKYGLDNLDPAYSGAVKNISNEMFGTGLMEFAVTLSGVKSEDQLKINYLNTLIQQNWIIIRQLNDISESLKK